jgi:hypothetical protein
VVELYDRNRLLARMFLNQRMQHANDGPICWQGQEAFWESLSAGCRFTDKGARPHLMIYAGKALFVSCSRSGPEPS